MTHFLNQDQTKLEKENDMEQEVYRVSHLQN